MKKYAFIFPLALATIFTACSSEIQVLDMNTKKPVEGAMVFARESNKLYPNSESIYFTDSDGVANVGRFGNLFILAGKDGYWIATNYCDRKNTVYLLRQSDTPLAYNERNTPFPAIVKAKSDVKNAEDWNEYCLRQELERKAFFKKQRK